MTASSCRVHIRWDNFRHNLLLLQEKGKTLMPVIKADAYGHGALRASEELSALGIDWAAIGTLEEGIGIRLHGYQGNIVSLLSRTPDGENIRLAHSHNIIPLIHSWDGLRAAAEALSALPDIQSFRFAVKMDTGMRRLGFRLEELEEVATFIASTPALSPCLLLSHFATADMPDEEEYTQTQAEIFQQGANILRHHFPELLCSLGNTAGLVSHTARSGDICRPGLAIYGYDPLFGTAGEGQCGPLLPVMEVTAPLVSVHPLHKGESLSYARTYTAESERLVGWVAIGYADGYKRNTAAGTCMTINGVRVPVIGRVTMQMTCVDLTDLPFTPKAGDMVHVLGGPGHAVSAQELADWWGTIPYEVICLLGKNSRA
ncbi:MAG: alanine racemase [Mailhella sp.]|nr:alanine racemase [Mailhella sp.]